MYKIFKKKDQQSNKVEWTILTHIQYSSLKINFNWIETLQSTDFFISSDKWWNIKVVFAIVYKYKYNTWIACIKKKSIKITYFNIYMNSKQFSTLVERLLAFIYEIKFMHISWIHGRGETNKLLENLILFLHLL